MGGVNDEPYELIVAELIAEVEQLAGKIDSARKPDSSYDYFKKDSRRKDMTFMLELKKLKESYNFGDDNR